MPNSRREFLTQSALTLLASTAALAQNPATPTTPGAPPAFGTAPAVGPEVSSETFAEAEKLVRAELTAAERAQAAGNWRMSMAALYERRTGPKKVALEAGLAPATQWNPVLPGMKAGPRRDRFVRSAANA